MDLTAGIVALDCEGAAIEEAVEAAAFGLGGASLGLRILDRGLAVNLDGDGLALDRDVVVKPLVVLVGRVVHDITHAVEASGFLGIALGGVDLCFKPFLRPSVFLKLGVELESGIGALLGQHREFGFGVREVGRGTGG